MRIDSFQPSQNIAETEQVKRRQQDKTASSQAPAQDSANLSDHARNLQEKLAATPEIRQERIDAIKKAVDAGTYHVSNSQLADAMMSEFSKKG
jgi:negative regulator of flagellin synthesis FlgM